MLRVACGPLMRYGGDAPAEAYRPPLLDNDELHAPTPFVIFSRPKLGTTLLHSLLNQHLDIRCDGEAMRADRVDALPPRNWTLAARDANRREFLDVLLSGTQSKHPVPGSGDYYAEIAAAKKAAASTDPKLHSPHAVGFAVQLDQITLPELWGLVFSPTVRKIIVRQSNPVDGYIEEHRIWAKDMYRPLTVDTADLLGALRAEEERDKCLEEARHWSSARFGGTDWHSVSYDRIFSAEKHGEHDFLGVHSEKHGEHEFLGICKHILSNSPNPAAPRCKASSFGALPAPPLPTVPRNQSIANFDEVWNALAEMPKYQRMLLR
jgi:hypothetical protein